jgi:hypothetical protein
MKPATLWIEGILKKKMRDSKTYSNEGFVHMKNGGMFCSATKITRHNYSHKETCHHQI